MSLGDVWCLISGSLRGFMSWWGMERFSLPRAGRSSLVISRSLHTFKERDFLHLYFHFFGLQCNVKIDNNLLFVS